MINHGYKVSRTSNVDVDRNLDGIRAALDILAKAIVAPSFATFVCLGNNGVGAVALIPPKMPDGTQPLYRALASMKLIACVDLTSNANLQTSFEQTLSANDSIRQLSTSNLSANTLAFIFQR